MTSEKIYLRFGRKFRILAAYKQFKNKYVFSLLLLKNTRYFFGHIGLDYKVFQFFIVLKTKSALFHIHRKNSADRGTPCRERLKADRLNFLIYHMAYHSLPVIRNLSQYLFLPVDNSD